MDFVIDTRPFVGVGLIAANDDTTEVPLPTFGRSETEIDITIEPVLVTADDTTTNDCEASDDYEFIIGNPDVAPNGGVFTVTLGSETTAEMGPNVSAKTLQTELSAMFVANGKPECIVRKQSDGVYRVTGGTVGALTASSVTLDFSQLWPVSTGSVMEESLGDTDARYSLLIVLRQVPPVYQSTFTVGSTSAVGTVNLNTIELYQESQRHPGNSFKLPLLIRRTRGDEIRNLLGPVDVTIYKDSLNPGTATPTSQPSGGGGGGSGASALSDIYVATDGNDAAAGTVNAPLETLGQAVTNAIAETPTAANPIVIHVGRGVFAEGAIAISSSYISIIGDGMNSTVIQPSSTNAITISAANTHISNLTISRAAAGNAAFVLTMTGTTFATYKDDIVLTNVLVRNNNTSGAAIATCVAHTKGCRIEATASGGTGIEQVYGGIHDNLEVVAGKYAIRYAQSATTAAGSQSFANSRPVIFNTPYLAQTDTTGGHVIQGLVESATMNQTVTVGVNWFAPRVNGGKLHAACVPTASTAGTSEALRGCIHLFGVGIDGDRWTTHWFDSYANACYWSQQTDNGITDIMSGVNSCIITGGSMILAGTSKMITMVTGTSSAMNGVSFEQDPTKRITFDQWRLIGCTDAVTQQVIGHTRQDLAALVDNTNYVIETEDTTTYNLATATFECWVKLNSSSSDGAFLSLPSSTNNGFYMAVQRATNQIYGGFNPAGSASIVQTNCSVLFGSNTTSGPYSDGWHHVAMTLGDVAGKQRLWLDGVEKTTAGAPPAGATPAPTSGRLIIGGQNASDSGGSALSLAVQGIITGVRISNIVRYVTGNTYTTATLKKHWEPDADTIGLWSDTTTGPKVWEDKMHNHDAALNANFPAPWVRQGYTP